MGIVLNLFEIHKRLSAGISLPLKTVEICHYLAGFRSEYRSNPVRQISFIVMMFTLTAAFGFGCLFGRLFNMNWKPQVLFQPVPVSAAARLLPLYRRL